MAVRDQQSEFGNQGEVLLHVGGEDHVHDGAPKLPMLALRQPPQEVAIQLLIPQQPASTAIVRPKSFTLRACLAELSGCKPFLFKTPKVDGSTVDMYVSKF